MAGKSLIKGQLLILEPISRVYCKYHYLEGHEFKTPEAEFRHFLTLFNNKFEWTEQYEADPNTTADINAERTPTSSSD